MPGDKMRCRREDIRPVTSRVNRFAVWLAAVLAPLLLDGGLSLAVAQAKLDATYSATLFGLPIGHISWTVELRNNRFTSAATAGFPACCEFFPMDTVTFRPEEACPEANRSRRILR
jgi:hypothetical protein